MRGSLDSDAMNMPAFLWPLLSAGLLAACSWSASPPVESPPASTLPAAGGWGQPITPAASAPQPLRLQGEAAPRCVPEGGDCGPPQAQCCAGYTCAGLNRSICITKH